MNLHSGSFPFFLNIYFAIEFTSGEIKEGKACWEIFLKVKLKSC